MSLYFLNTGQTAAITLIARVQLDLRFFGNHQSNACAESLANGGASNVNEQCRYA